MILEKSPRFTSQSWLEKAALHSLKCILCITLYDVSSTAITCYSNMFFLTADCSFHSLCYFTLLQLSVKCRFLTGKFSDRITLSSSTERFYFAHMHFQATLLSCVSLIYFSYLVSAWKCLECLHQPVPVGHWCKIDWMLVINISGGS